MNQVKELAKLKPFCDENGIIAALAIDQRGALKKMLGDETSATEISAFKCLVSNNLTKYSSAILLDPEYGWDAAAKRANGCGLLMAYEKTGYDKAAIGRLPDLLPDQSVYRLKQKGADGIKILLYIDIDEDQAINVQKEAFVERIGYECAAHDIAFFLELVTYSSLNLNEVEYAKVKPHKVLEAMKLYSQDRFKVTVLKVEIPVNMKYVEGFGDEIVYTQAQARQYFKEQNEATHLPFIFLSAGVSTQLFKQTLEFAQQAGSKFNGVLCGRATWADGAKTYKEQGVESTKQWLAGQGIKNLEELNKILKTAAKPVLNT